MSTPLVTVSIPTFNSAKTLGLALESIRKQTYKNIHINIVDKNSTDGTLEVAKKYKVEETIAFGGNLLAARYEGLKRAKGKYFLILDSDQVLEKNTIKRAIKIFETMKVDMVALEEHVYKTDNLVEKLFEMDRKVIETNKDLSPFTGVIMPRFYRTKLLRVAFQKVPNNMLSKLGGQDHAVIYYECYRLSQMIEILPNAVRHIEPDSVVKIVKKCFRWGYTGADAHYGKYQKLMTKKERLRTGLFQKGLILESFGSIAISALKGVPYKCGLYLAKMERKLGKKTRRYG